MPMKHPIVMLRLWYEYSSLPNKRKHNTQRGRLQPVMHNAG